jgi:hypothetical protein
MKRQRGRNRGGGNQGKPQQHNANRAFESNGPDNVKIRGNAQHVFERYQQLARDAAQGGDRVLAENHLQHAEHYFRVIRAIQPNRTTAEIVGRETFTSGFDIDFEDESGAQAEPEVVETPEGGEDGQPPQQQRQDRFEGRDRDRNFNRDDRPRESQRDYNRDDRPRDDRPRDDRPREDRPRDDRPRDDRPREDRPRDDRPRDDRPREDRPRDDRPREDRPRDDRPFNRDRNANRDRNFNRDRDRPFRDDRAAEPAAEAPAPAPAPAEPQGAVLRSEDGDMSQMPAFLKAREPRAAEAAVDAEAAPKPRRRRAPRDAEPAGTEEA